MPAVSFIPGPGDTQASNPLAQMGTLMSILRENKESTQRIAASQAAIQEASQRGEVARQQAILLGLEIKDFPSKQADARELQQAQIAEHQAASEHYQNQDFLAQQLAPAQEASHWATAGAEVQRQRAESARADQLDYDDQQLKQFDQELKKPENKSFLSRVMFGDEGPGANFNYSYRTLPFLQQAAQLQVDTRLKQQHGEMYDAIAGKAKDWARVQEDRITSSGTSKNITQITQLAKINPAAAAAWQNDSDPVVASAARIIAATPKAEKALTSDQLMARVAMDQNAPPEARQKALIWMGQMRGLKPDPVQGSFDMTTGQSIPPHYDWDGFQQRLQEQAKIITDAIQPQQQTAPMTSTTSQSSTQPTKGRPSRATARQYVSQYGTANAQQKLKEDGYDTAGYSD